MFMLFSLVMVFGFVILGIIIGLLNPVSVELNVFFTTLQLPLSVVMSSLLVLGMGLGGIIVFFQVIKLRWTISTKTREIQKLSDQVVQLKKANIQVKEKLSKEDNESSTLLIPNQ